jgi:predicted DNA binding CopG/RHH family protein
MEIVNAPVFANEDEEADWWFENREKMAELFLKAADEGDLGRGTVKNRSLARQAMIQLAENDIVLAKSLAERRGMPYQTYLKMLIHEALEREERQAS